MNTQVDKVWLLVDQGNDGVYVRAFEIPELARSAMAEAAAAQTVVFGNGSDVARVESDEDYYVAYDANDNLIIDLEVDFVSLEKADNNTDAKLSEALSIVSEAAFLRAGVWRSSIGGELYQGNELECFLEADDTEREQMAERLEQASEFISAYRKRLFPK